MTTRSARQPGRDQAAVSQAEDARGRDGRGAIGGERRRAKLDRRADHEIEMALLRDVERIAVVGAEGDERRIALSDDGGESMKILAHRAFPDEQLHAFGELLRGFRKVGDLMVGARTGAQVAVEGGAAKQRAVSVDRPGLERRELGEAGRIARQNAGKVHEFGQAQHLGMIGELQKIIGLEASARGLERRRRNAARELHAQVHRRQHRGVEEITQASQPEDIRDLVRVADRRRHAML